MVTELQECDYVTDMPLGTRCCMLTVKTLLSLNHSPISHLETTKCDAVFVFLNVNITECHVI